MCLLSIPTSRRDLAPLFCLLARKRRDRLPILRAVIVGWNTEIREGMMSTFLERNLAASIHNSCERIVRAMREDQWDREQAPVFPAMGAHWSKEEDTEVSELFSQALAQATEGMESEQAD